MSFDWTMITRAVVLGVVVAVLQYILKVGDVWMLDFHMLVNNAVLAAASSLLVSLGTSSNTGKFIGAVKVER